MALPADFNKIFGSTATGGLTPIGDVNYAKGWEFVGSNPPTKNDFSYLQNLSDLKSQWLYSNKLQRSDPFGDIKSDGAAAISKALTNLGLKTAALRDVGTGANQIPDMSAFPSGGAGSSWWFKLPDGTIVQFGVVTNMTVNAISPSYPIAFPSEVKSIVIGATGGAAANSVPMVTIDLGNPQIGTKLTNFTASGYNAAVGGAVTKSNVAFYWVAIGK